ncbi:MAG: alpha/beta fold hydrolase [Pyrinomonadaceae bacterium]
MSKVGNLWKTMLAGGAGVAALAAMNASIRRNASDPDDSALGGEARFFAWKYGRIFYKTAGIGHSGPPLLFIHGVGAGSSSFMWRKNFDALARDFRVYAFDLLGFTAPDGSLPSPLFGATFRPLAQTRHRRLLSRSLCRTD